jgi:ADP-heptose:LPS heptosyltransferase
LLLAQPWITRVTVIKTNIPFDYANPTELGVDYILDSFRAHAQDPKMHLIYMHALPFKANLNVSEPWLEAPRTGAQKEPYLTINLTPRVRTLSHQYYEELLFGFPAEQIFWIGLPKEQIERRNIQGNTVHSTNFLDLAALIQNSALFIGNSSFPYALAEGLKVKRLVETPENNVVYPLDASGLVLAEMSMKQARAKIADALQAPLIDSSIRITADTQRDIILLHEALVDAHHMSVKRGVSMIVQSILSKLGVYDFFKRISDAVATKKD